MCGRLAIHASLDLVVERFLVDPVEGWRPRYNVAPTQQVFCVREEGGQRFLDELRWGLVPSWSTDPGRILINARSETAPSKPSFRAAFKRRRLLVPVSGFYEWKKVGKDKVPFLFHRRDDQPLALAGLWETWHDLDGEPLRTFTILTTGPSALMKPIHDRMPVILPEARWARWLDEDNRDKDDLQAMLEPLEGDELVAVRVSAHVNNARNDDPRCIVPVEQQTLF